MGKKILHIFTLLSTPKAFFDGQFAYLSSKGYNITVMSASEEDKEFSERNAITYHQEDIKRQVSPVADLKTIFKLARYIRKEKYDAVIGHTPKGAMIAMMASKLAGTKLRVYYRHGLIYTTAKGLSRRIFKLVEQLTSACANRIVNVSPSLSRLAVDDHLNSDHKQMVVGDGTCGGIDCKNIFNPELINSLQKDQLRKSLGIEEGDFVVGFCGRICKDKGIRELIDGFESFNMHNPSIRTKLLLVGAYDERDILPEEYKKNIDSKPDIIHAGPISQDRLPLYYSLMNLFVFPSYREGFGMCVIEAGAMGLPALVSKSHGCIDSIEEHVTGEYLTEITPKGIVQGLKIMAHGNTLKALAKQCRENIMKKYDRSVMWPKILQLYQSGFRMQK